MRYHARVGIVGLCLFLAAGCDVSGEGTINGTVTWNGEPLKKGTVNFISTDGKAPTSSATITDGKFTAKLPKTTMKVQISAPRPTGKSKKMYDTADSPEVEIVDELLPPKYNTNSELTITVKGGTQDEKFELKK